MTFQYFFFDTVAGYFLQALPFALAAGVWYALRLHKKEPALPGGRVVLRSLFPCYFAGLLVFTIFLYPVSDLYYLLFYGRPSQGGLPWFVMDYDFPLTFSGISQRKTVIISCCFCPLGFYTRCTGRRQTGAARCWRGCAPPLPLS